MDETKTDVTVSEVPTKTCTYETRELPSIARSVYIHNTGSLAVKQLSNEENVMFELGMEIGMRKFNKCSGVAISSVNRAISKDEEENETFQLGMGHGMRIACHKYLKTQN